MAAIRHVADRVPCRRQIRRVIVKRGLEGLNRVANHGTEALLEGSGLKEGRSPARDRSPSGRNAYSCAGRMASEKDSSSNLFLARPLPCARRTRVEAHATKATSADRRPKGQGLFKTDVDEPVTDTTQHSSSPATDAIAEWSASSRAASSKTFTGGLHSRHRKRPGLRARPFELELFHC